MFHTETHKIWREKIIGHVDIFHGLYSQIFFHHSTLALPKKIVIEPLLYRLMI